MVRSLLLPVLDLEACGSGHAVNRGWLPPALGLGWLSKRLGVPQGLMLPSSRLED